MTARDESAQQERLEALLMEGASDNGLWMGGLTAQALAAHILVDGFRKPRTVTTREELDQLAAEAVVRSSVGVVWEKYTYEHDDEDGDDFWQQVGLQRMYASSKITLPATVLYEPRPKS